MSPFNEKCWFLEACCRERDDTRYKMDLPFRIGEHVFATNAQILVRWRTKDDPPRMAKADTALPPTGFLNLDQPLWDESPVPRRIIAPPIFRKCEACHGEKGSEEAMRCLQCSGEGATLINPIVRIAGLPTISRRYAVMLHAAAARLHRKKTGNSTDPVRFTIGVDMDGLVMPVSDPEREGGGVIHRLRREEDQS